MNGNQLGGFIPGLPTGFNPNTSNGSSLPGMGSITMMQANAALLGSSDPKAGVGGLQGLEASLLTTADRQAPACMVASLAVNPTTVSSMSSQKSSGSGNSESSPLMQQQQAIIARQQELLMAQQFRKPAVVPSQKLMNSILPKPSAAGRLTSAGVQSSFTNDAQQMALTNRNIQNYLNMGIVSSRSNQAKNAPETTLSVTKGILMGNRTDGGVADLRSISLASMSSLLVDSVAPTAASSMQPINQIPTTLTNLRPGESPSGNRNGRKHRRQQEDEDEERPPPSDKPSLLHQACHLYPDTTSVVLSALRVDPGSVRRRVFTSVSAAGADNQANDVVSSGGDGQRKKKAKSDGFYYPINIAVWSRASEEIVHLLAKEGRDVLNKKDGPEDCNALANALYRFNPKTADYSLKVVATLLKYGSKELLQETDRYRNLPLHVACLKGCNVRLIRLLVQLDPAAVCSRNFHQETPLDVAQRSQLCSEDVIDYLQKASFDCFEERAAHLDEEDTNPVALHSGAATADDDDPLCSLEPFSL